MASNDRINRSISPDRFDAFLNDFAFLFERIRLEKGELDLRLRKNYFNLYHRGNSLAKVEVRAGGYPISIHKVFADGLFATPRFGVPRQQGKYVVFDVAPNLLNAFLSKKNIDSLAAKIAARNFSEEITFEQMVITDNLNREDFHIVDRQVCGGSLGREKMDLLALEQVQPGARQYRLIVLEAKLGNNSELCEEVGQQLTDYMNVMNRNFDEFKECYESNYAQMWRTGILTGLPHKTIEIVPSITGWVVVGGYSGIAAGAINQLKQKWPQVQIKTMFHRW